MEDVTNKNTHIEKVGDQYRFWYKDGLGRNLYKTFAFEHQAVAAEEINKAGVETGRTQVVEEMKKVLEGKEYV